MNIVNFTPLSALTGGLLIGLSVALFFILNGRMIGISGIASNLLVYKDNRIDNFLFLHSETNLFESFSFISIK